MKVEIKTELLDKARVEIRPVPCGQYVLDVWVEDIHCGSVHYRHKPTSFDLWDIYQVLRRGEGLLNKGGLK